MKCSHDTVVRFGTVGGDKFAVIAGPCSVESEEQLLSVAEVVKKHAVALWCAYKPRQPI